MRELTSISAETFFMELLNMALLATWIMLAVLAACIIVVGTVMAVWNHRRLKRGYVPDMSEYEDVDPDGSAGAEA